MCMSGPAMGVLERSLESTSGKLLSSMVLARSRAAEAVETAVIGSGKDAGTILRAMQACHPKRKG